MSKIVNNLQELVQICKKNKKKTIVFTNGCFDILHIGHVNYLKKSKELGDILIVGLNSDSSVKRLKGANRPINSEENRAAVLEALEFVDYIYVFDDTTPLEIISKIHPNIYTKGGDYKMDCIIGPNIGSKVIENYGGKVILIPIEYDISTTGIINKILNL